MPLTQSSASLRNRADTNTAFIVYQKLCKYTKRYARVCARARVRARSVSLLASPFSRQPTTISLCNKSISRLGSGLGVRSTVYAGCMWRTLYTVRRTLVPPRGYIM